MYKEQLAINDKSYYTAVLVYKTIDQSPNHVINCIKYRESHPVSLGILPVSASVAKEIGEKIKERGSLQLSYQICWSCKA